MFLQASVSQSVHKEERVHPFHNAMGQRGGCIQLGVTRVCIQGVHPEGVNTRDFPPPLEVCNPLEE